MTGSPPSASPCWFCGGWTLVRKVDTGETSWNDQTGGEHGERRPVYRIEPSFGSGSDAELITCPFCGGRG